MAAQDNVEVEIRRWEAAHGRAWDAWFQTNTEGCSCSEPARPDPTKQRFAKNGHTAPACLICYVPLGMKVLDHEPALPLFLAANLEAKAEYESMAWISRRSLCQRVLLPRLEALGYRDNGNGITVGNVFYTWNGGVSIDGSAAGKKTRAPIVAGRRLIGHPVSGTPAQELQLVPRLDEGLAGVPRLAEVPRSAEVPRPAEVPPLAETLSRDDPDFFDAIGSLCELARAPQPQPSQSTLDHQKLPQLKVCFFSADSAQEPEFLMYVKLLDGLFQEWNDRNPRNRERRCLDSHDIPHFVGEGLTEWSLAKPFEFVDPHAAAGAPKRCVNRVLIVARASDTLLVSFLALVIVAGNAYLVALYTHPHHRKQGLAFEALSQLSCVLDQWGIGAVVPDTHCVQKILQVPFIYKLYANSGWVVQQDPVDKQLKAISYCPGAYATIMCGPTDCHENEKSVRSGRLLRSRR